MGLVIIGICEAIFLWVKVQGRIQKRKLIRTYDRQSFPHMTPITERAFSLFKEKSKMGTGFQQNEVISCISSETRTK